MPGRTFTADNSYRYGFNGKENDNEVKGEGNQQDYGFRIYDPRLGRFLSIDPLMRKYPMSTPYQYASNNPIALIDVEGMESGKPEPTPGDRVKISNIIRGYGYGVLGFSNSGYSNEGDFIDAATKSSGSNYKYGAWWRLAHNIMGPSWLGAKGVTGEGVAANGEWQYFKAFNAEQTQGRTLPIASISFHESSQQGTYDFRIDFSPTSKQQLTTTFNNADGSNKKVNFDISAGSKLTALYEVKTLSSSTAADVIQGYIEHGVTQTIENIQKNSASANSKTAGILIIDKDAYMKAYSANPGAIKPLIDKLTQAGGYLKLSSGLNKEATKFTNAIIKDIKNKTSRKASDGKTY